MKNYLNVHGTLNLGHHIEDTNFIIIVLYTY